ncbi:MAG TPA: alpha/beta fold hydrolase [Vicinamibacteria bacterium]|nr:alpha/beta fold hydrolase [Vicinamibacteria bacterium]
MGTVVAILLGVAVGHLPSASATDQAWRGPEAVVIPNGPLELRALVWRPKGNGPFPAILFNHGSGPRSESDGDTLGPLFARHGYVFLFPFRRGQGPSMGQGVDSDALLDRELKLNGEDARDRLQVRLLETDQLSDAVAALNLLRSLPQVDARRVAAVGHSFGGSLTLLLAERDGGLRASVVFAGAAASWDRCPPLRARLLEAVRRTSVPTLFVYAANDFSVAPAQDMGAQMSRLAKPHDVRIYPAFGATSADGHRLVYLGSSTWEHDVFLFLDEHVGR